MLYLEELTVRNFKSFRNTTIKFTNGFNCVVGPNGSGKSNICDALLFALGESSLSRLRAVDDKSGRRSVAYLVSSLLKGEASTRRAIVRIKLGGDKAIEITRGVRADKKSGYRLDGKRVTRKDVIETLRSVQSEISDANTIAQGEIEELIHHNPNQRRELIDIAAGISEFNEKKDASIRELDKVDAKINEAKVMLGERSGFLKELEKDKASAEQYISLTDRIKQMTYTRLKMREHQVTQELDTAISSSRGYGAAKQEASKKIAEAETKMASLTSEREQFTKTLNARSGEAGSTAKLLEETEKSLAVNAADQKSTETNMEQTKGRISQLQDETTKAKSKQKENSQEISKLDVEITAKGKNIPELGYGTGSQDGIPLAERAEANRKELAAVEDKLRVLASDEARLKAEYSSTEFTLTEAQRAVNAKGADRLLLTEKIQSNKIALTALQKDKKELEEEYKKEKDALDKLVSEIDAMYKSEIEAKEQLSQLGGSSASRLNDWLKKNLKKGFHGMLQDLISYDEKYAAAVSASAGARINYFVVDSIAVCDEAVSLLKQHKAGRATFIPLKEINAKETKEREGANALISVVKADAKYQRALDYVFSNTYIVANIAVAQKLGVGASRYVTIDGDLVEQSGVVTGGMAKAQQSASLIEARLKKLAKEKEELATRKKQEDSTLESISKKLGNQEASITHHEIEIKHLLNEEESVNRALDELMAKSKANTEKITKFNSEINHTRVGIKALDEQAKNLREVGSSLNTTLQGLLLQTGAAGKTKEEMKKYKDQLAEINKLKEQRTKLDTENEVGMKRLEEVKQSTDKEKADLSNLESRKQELEKGRLSLQTQKKELEDTIKTQGAKNANLYDHINQINEKVTKLSEERGKLQNQIERAERDLITVDSRKSQLETTLADIKAELVRNPVMELIKDADIAQLELEITKDTVRREGLGSVNLKAPEMYASKKKDVDEANEKLLTLETEKSKILSAIEELEKKKVGIFMDTYNSVNENFKKLFGYAFPGEASLRLQDPKDIFNTGLVFELKPQHGNVNTAQFSGGQRAMLMIILVLSIVVRKPKAFYIFDEIDSALDKENSKLLSKLIKELSSKSQFIVVSHNDTMISSADTAIGVVKRNGESQVVGVQLTAK